MQRSGIGIWGVLTIGVIAAIVAVAAGILPFRQIIAQQESVALANAKLDALRAENMLLEQQIAALKTPAEVERLAREHFGLVKPGEIGYVARAIPVVNEVAPIEETPLAPANKPWWADFWDFLTGNDVGDG